MNKNAEVDGQESLCSLTHCQTYWGTSRQWHQDGEDFEFREMGCTISVLWEPFHYPRNITTMVRTVHHDSRGCILDTSREHVHCRFVPTSSHDMMTVVMKFLARALSEYWIVYLSLSLHLPRSCQCHCILFVFHVWTASGPSVRTPVNLRSHLYIRTQNVFGNFNYVVFGNH